MKTDENCLPYKNRYKAQNELIFKAFFAKITIVYQQKSQDSKVICCNIVLSAYSREKCIQQTWHVALPRWVLYGTSWALLCLYLVYFFSGEAQQHYDLADDRTLLHSLS